MAGYTLWHRNRLANCTFGGPDRSTLFITDLTGSLYAARTDLRVRPLLRTGPKHRLRGACLSR
ncbi:hypothetical protein [Halocatena marina]|uniref:SMP-30/Gluconolactonase/LRE-like region domain-containing protein n=1 Tax=Halocatena marina TaxID=2934937 RepID=A0ABD5YVV5_9EURY|nr:hypothetical protein [Halocatena marina]